MTRMLDDRTNLLPQRRRAALRRDYALRLGVVAALLASMLALSAAALLIPAYAFLSRSEAAEQARLASLEAALPPKDEAVVSIRLAALSSNIKTLTALASARSPSTLIRSLLAIPHEDIMLSGFTYASASGKQSETFTVSGQAGTRDALRTYQLALQNVPFISSADLPVSAYAKDTNIPFDIVMTLAP